MVYVSNIHTSLPVSTTNSYLFQRFVLLYCTCSGFRAVGSGSFTLKVYLQVQDVLFTFPFLNRMAHHFYSRFLINAQSAQWPTPPRHLGNFLSINFKLGVTINLAMNILYCRHFGRETLKDLLDRSKEEQ